MKVLPRKLEVVQYALRFFGKEGMVFFLIVLFVNSVICNIILDKHIKE